MIQFILVLGLAGFWPGSAAAQQLSKPESTIAALLKQARQALAQDRLTLPPDHSAVSYAERVLDLDPDNPQAAQILGDVVKRYNSLGTVAVDRSKAFQAQDLKEARRYQIAAKLLLTKPYQLPSNARLESLAERLERMEAKGAMKLPVSTYREERAKR